MHRKQFERPIAYAIMFTNCACRGQFAFMNRKRPANHVQFHKYFYDGWRNKSQQKLKWWCSKGEQKGWMVVELLSFRVISRANWFHFLRQTVHVCEATKQSHKYKYRKCALSWRKSRPGLSVNKLENESVTITLTQQFQARLYELTIYIAE